MAIIINKPYIEKLQNGKVRLCSKIEGSINDVLYYEVDEKYEQCLCDDRVDAFLTGLLNYAMYAKEDICCKGDITGDLLFQLRVYYIPILAQNNKDLHNISISGTEAYAPIENANGVGTGNSGGVDSLYTILKYKKAEMGENRLTHLLFNNISTGDNEEERIRALFERDCEEKKKIADELDLEFVSLYTNLFSLYSPPGLFNMYYTAQYVSAAYSLAKLFKTFYFSSAYPVEEFSLSMTVVNKSHDSACYDLFSLECLSSRHLKLYSAGMEASRVEKVRYISDNPIVQRHLQVCAIEQDAGNQVQLSSLNCGCCRKCRRTILQLYAFGKLDAFENVFDLSAFRSNTGKYVGKGLAADYPAFSRGIKVALKKDGKMPSNEWIWERLYRVRYFLSKNKSLVAFYHKLKKTRKQL